MVRFEEEPRVGPPSYMVSFADMMTLVLTFFIVLVSLSVEQKLGLMAKGLGSFVVALKSHGLDGILSAKEELQVFDEVRRRFMLPEELDPERREDPAEASEDELIRADVVEALEPSHETLQPQVALFASGSAELDASSRAYLDLLAETLRPARGQLLVLEGHARGDAWLAHERAERVRTYLVEKHRFPPDRIDARAWMSEVERPDAGARSVDARLVTPRRAKAR